MKWNKFKDISGFRGLPSWMVSDANGHKPQKNLDEHSQNCWEYLLLFMTGIGVRIPEKEVALVFTQAGLMSEYVFRIYFFVWNEK